MIKAASCYSSNQHYYGQHHVTQGHTQSAFFMQKWQIASLTFRNLDFLKTNVHAYFKGILFHYYQDFPYICIYCWKGNILENLYLLEKFFSEVT